MVREQSSVAAHTVRHEMHSPPVILSAAKNPFPPSPGIRDECHLPKANPARVR